MPTPLADSSLFSQRTSSMLPWISGVMGSRPITAQGVPYYQQNFVSEIRRVTAGRLGRVEGRGHSRGRKSLLRPQVSLAGAHSWMDSSGGILTGGQQGSGFPLESRGSPSPSPLGQRPWSPATTSVWTLIWFWTFSCLLPEMVDKLVLLDSSPLTLDS
ncbi:hypothetical protein MC885_014322, partial [Smutsia gigantea]